MEKLEPLDISSGKVKLFSHCGKQLGSRVPQKVEYRFTMTQHSIHRYIFKRMESWYLGKYMLPIYNSTIHTSKKKHLKCPSTNEWITNSGITWDRILFSHNKEQRTDKCYNVDELQKHAKERSQSPKTKYCIILFHLYETSKNGKSIQQKAHCWLPGDREQLL